jgi:serine protease Do
MKPRLILPALAAVAAAGGAFYSLQAQDALRNERHRNGPAPGLARFAQLTIEESDEGADDAAPGRPRVERFEFRNDGAGPRYFRNGREVKPGENSGDDEADNPGDPRFRQMQKQMEDLLRRHMGEGSGPGDDLFDDFFRQMRERNPRQGDGNGNGNGLPDLFRRFQQQQSDGHAAGASTRYCKHHRSVLAEWRPLVKSARESTVQIKKDNKQVAFGTVVSADGYALTKASEVTADGLECEFHDGRIVSAKVVDKLDSYDLALIKLDASGLTPARFSRNDAEVGTLVAAVGVDEDPLATGIISVAARSLSEKGKGALGIQFDTTADESGKGVIIGKVIDDCAACTAGLKTGDVILAVNGTEVDFPFQLQRLVAAMKPGDPVKLRYLRDGNEAQLEFALSSREELAQVQREQARRESGIDLSDRRQLDLTAQMGSRLSGNASGYPNAVQSDLTINSQDCGGPVVDVDGNVIAINIARAERVKTYMIPGRVVQSLLSNLPSGKFTLAKDVDTLQGELRDYESAIRKAQEAMKAAEASRAEAEAALRKLRQQ